VTPFAPNTEVKGCEPNAPASLGSRGWRKPGHFTRLAAPTFRRCKTEGRSLATRPADKGRKPRAERMLARKTLRRLRAVDLRAVAARCDSSQLHHTSRSPFNPRAGEHFPRAGRLGRVLFHTVIRAVSVKPGALFAPWLPIALRHPPATPRCPPRPAASPTAARSVARAQQEGLSARIDTFKKDLD
jgi:hypothetical protein